MTTTRSGPPIPPVLHRSLLTGQLILTGVMVVLRSGDTGATLSDDNQMLGYGFSALSLVLVAVALLLLKPRVPAREPRQPVEEYWSSVTGTILPMWFVMEGAGLIAIVGYFLTGEPVTAVAIAISIGAFIWYGPKAFARAWRPPRPERLQAAFLVPGFWVVPVALFVAAWIFQFVGHAFEGKPPEFFHDWRFLFVGLRWWMAKVRGRA